MTKHKIEINWVEIDSIIVINTGRRITATNTKWIDDIEIQWQKWRGNRIGTVTTNQQQQQQPTQNWHRNSLIE